LHIARSCFQESTEALNNEFFLDSIQLRCESLEQGTARTVKRTLFLLTPFLVALFLLSLHIVTTFAQEPAKTVTDSGFGLIAAGLAVGLSGIGAGIAIHGSTSAGMAAMVERPELTTWVLVFAGLGEGIAIYGLVVAILVLGKL
jgi:V/A-type H+-transporting ATPase subunit K